MKKYIVIVVVVLAIGVVAVLASPKASDENKTATVATKQPAVNAKLAAVQKSMKAGAILVDVRTPEEYATSHAVSSVNLAYDKITADTYPTTDKTKKIYVYCHTGKRAGVALDALKAAGYTNTESLTSLDSWISLGGKVTSS